MLDQDVVAASPSSVYRILKKEGLLNKWNVAKRSCKGKGFTQPDYPHKHWHTDIKYLNFNGTLLFLISILDGYSRFVLHHEVRHNMAGYDVQLTIQKAKEKYPSTRPRIITDNGAQYISKEFKTFIKNIEVTHIKTSVAYPQSNGKICPTAGGLNASIELLVKNVCEQNRRLPLRILRNIFLHTSSAIKPSGCMLLYRI